MRGLVCRIRSFSTSDGRDGIRKGQKYYKEKKLNRLIHGLKVESKRNSSPGVNSMDSFQPNVAEAFTAMQEEYMDLVDFMRLKVLFPKEVLNLRLIIDKEEVGRACNWSRISKENSRKCCLLSL